MDASVGGNSPGAVSAGCTVGEDLTVVSGRCTSAGWKAGGGSMVNAATLTEGTTGVKSSGRGSPAGTDATGAIDPLPIRSSSEVGWGVRIVLNVGTAGSGVDVARTPAVELPAAGAADNPPDRGDDDDAAGTVIAPGKK